ncbi:hypothetical protein SAMN05444337_0513 [Flavobacterium haoranii]|uniref:Uncharacterized protein n=1 Tax=Flavobacterium haoranii TaxID=683124 RepID=A0A1M6D0K9_9FLAO|nr:hypothetical protein SAMN05444337_0513 [Flavobacterium haoranii]
MPDSFNQELKKDRIGIFIISISIIILSIFFFKKTIQLMKAISQNYN